MPFPSLTLYPGPGLYPGGGSIGPDGPESDGVSTMYAIGDTFAAVKDGQPYVDADGTWWSIKAEEGWASGPQPRSNITKWTGQDGQTSSQLQLEARQIALRGTIHAGSTQLLHKAMDAVTALLADSVREDILTVAEPHVRRHLSVHRVGEPLVARWSPHTATFDLLLEADDPRRLGDTLTATTRLPSTTGDWVFPFTFPFSIDSAAIAGVCSLTNPGSANGPMVLRVDGPCEGPVITHHGSGSILEFASGYSVIAGNWLTIDLENQVVLENDQASRATSIVRAEWFQFEPGLNTLGFSNSGPYNPVAQLTAMADPAWP